MKRQRTSPLLTNFLRMSGSVIVEKCPHAGH
jgi:hypothetical protein